MVHKETNLKELYNESIKKLLNSPSSDPELAFEDYMFFNISNIKKSHITYDGNNFAQQIPLFEHKLFESKSIHYIKTFSKFSKTLDNIINDEYSKRHIFQVWNESMMLGEKTESLNYVYFRVKNGFLDAYFHLRANDAFNFAYLNFEMFSAVFDYACIYTKKTRGRFIYTVDCYHIYKCDQKKVYNKYCNFIPQ